MSTQWWARGIANTAPVRLPPPFTVAPGDQVLSVLTASDPQNVVFVMVRITAFVPAHARATGRSDDRGNVADDPADQCAVRTRPNQFGPCEVYSCAL